MATWPSSTTSIHIHAFHPQRFSRLRTPRSRPSRQQHSIDHDNLEVRPFKAHHISNMTPSHAQTPGLGLPFRSLAYLSTCFSVLTCQAATHSATASSGTRITASTTDAQFEWHSEPKCGSALMDTALHRHVQLSSVSAVVEALTA